MHGVKHGGEMTKPKGRAMIGHQDGGRCVAAFTDQLAFTHIEKFGSEKEAKRWIMAEAKRLGIAEEDITWLPGTAGI